MKTQNQKITDAIAALENHIVGECRAIDVEKHYDEMLNDCYSFSSVGGPFADMSPADVLKEMDECAYNEGRNDFADSRCKDGEWIEVAEEYFESAEVKKEKENFIFEYADELRGDDVPEDEIEEIIEELESYDF